MEHSREPLRFGRGLHVEIVAHAPREIIVGAERGGAVAHLARELEHAPHRGLAVRQQLEPAPRRGQSAGVIARCPPLLHEGRRRVAHHRVQPSSLRLEPSLELRCVRDVEALKELALIRIERTLPIALVDGRLHRDGIAAHQLMVDAHEPVTRSDDRRLAERLPRGVQRVAERVSSSLLIRLGPEKGDQRVARMQPARPRHGEIRQHGQPARLRHERVRRVAPTSRHVDRPEHLKLNELCLHGRHPGALSGGDK